MPYQHEASLGRLTQLASKSMGHRLDELFAERELPYTSDNWTVLSFLQRFTSANQRDIAYFMGKDKVTLKRLLDKMEKEGLLTRTPWSEDRRYNIVALTSRGESVYNNLAPFAEQVLKEATEGIHQETIESCQATLKEIISNLTR